MIGTQQGLTSACRVPEQLTQDLGGGSLQWGSLSLVCFRLQLQLQSTRRGARGGLSRKAGRVQPSGGSEVPCASCKAPGPLAPFASAPAAALIQARVLTQLGRSAVPGLSPAAPGSQPPRARPPLLPDAGSACPARPLLAARARSPGGTEVPAPPAAARCFWSCVWKRLGAASP